MAFRTITHILDSKLKDLSYKYYVKQEFHEGNYRDSMLY